MLTLIIILIALDLLATIAYGTIIVFLQLATIGHITGVKKPNH